MGKRVWWQANEKALDGEEVRRKKMGWREWQVNELEMEVGSGGRIEKRRGIMESLRGGRGGGRVYKR